MHCAPPAKYWRRFWRAIPRNRARGLLLWCIPDISGIHREAALDFNILWFWIGERETKRFLNTAVTNGKIMETSNNFTNISILQFEVATAWIWRDTPHEDTMIILRLLAFVWSCRLISSSVARRASEIERAHKPWEDGALTSSQATFMEKERSLCGWIWWIQGMILSPSLAMGVDVHRRSGVLFVNAILVCDGLEEKMSLTGHQPPFRHSPTWFLLSGNASPMPSKG